MKKLILWKKVTKNDNWEISGLTELGDPYWLKRIVINILGNKEIEKMAEYYNEGWGTNNDAESFKEGFKAMQERLIGGEGMNYPNIRASEVNTPSNEGSSF